MAQKGDYAGAEPLFRRALEARERTLGKEHPDTLTSVHNLANLLRTKATTPGRRPLYRRALEARERTLGKEHPDTLLSVNNLANLLAAERRLRRGGAALPAGVGGARAHAGQGASRHAGQRE